MTALLALVLVATGEPSLTTAARVEHERAVERARYRFVVGATQPFDEVYPRSVFESRVAREAEKEIALHRVFGLAVTPDLLGLEFDRIEKTTQAPEQWQAIKEALGNDRRLVEEVFCRPLLVDRVLRAKFAFDQTIHEQGYRKAREARAAFLAGGSAAESSVALFSRRSESAPSTPELLEKARTEAAFPRVLAPREDPKDGVARPVEAELAAVLEKELLRPGDVTTILEMRESFEIYRLVEVTAEAWKVEAVRFPKIDFDTWLATQWRGPTTGAPGRLALGR